MATQQTFASAAIPLSASDHRAAASASRPKSPWILDRWRDLLFFVGTPVLLIPLFTIAQSRTRVAKASERGEAEYTEVSQLPECSDRYSC